MMEMTTEEIYLAEKIIKALRAEDTITIKIIKNKGKSLLFKREIPEYIK